MNNSGNTKDNDPNRDDRVRDGIIKQACRGDYAGAYASLKEEHPLLQETIVSTLAYMGRDNETLGVLSYYTLPSRGRMLASSHLVDFLVNRGASGSETLKKIYDLTEEQPISMQRNIYNAADASFAFRGKFGADGPDRRLATMFCNWKMSEQSAREISIELEALPQKYADPQDVARVIKTIKDLPKDLQEESLLVALGWISANVTEPENRALHKLIDSQPDCVKELLHEKLATMEHPPVAPSPEAHRPCETPEPAAKGTPRANLGN